MIHFYSSNHYNCMSKFTYGIIGIYMKKAIAFRQIPSGNYFFQCLISLSLFIYLYTYLYRSLYLCIHIFIALYICVYKPPVIRGFHPLPQRFLLHLPSPQVPLLHRHCFHPRLPHQLLLHYHLWLQ